MKLEAVLSSKRKECEDHIRELEIKGKAGKRYTSRMKNLTFFALALLCDAGWILQLVFGVTVLKNRFNAALLIATAGVVAGVCVTVWLNIIKEKEIALGWQKDISFGLTALSGLAGGIIGLVLGNFWLSFGGFLNFAAGLPIYLSFKPGIVYGIR